jgi:hypothetical protein
MSSKTQFRLKMTLYTVVLLVALLLDGAVFGALDLRYVPCVMPVAVACIGLWEGAEKGCIFGLVGGCLWAFSDALSMYGAWRIVTLTATGLISGFLAERFLLQGWKTAVSFSVPAIFLTDGLYVIFLTATDRLPGNALMTEFLPACLISLLFCVVFYPATQYISRIGGFHG